LVLSLFLVLFLIAGSMQQAHHAIFESIFQHVIVQYSELPL